MKDTDGETLTPPNTGPLSRDELRPLIAGAVDEIVPYAVSLIVDGEPPEAALKRLLQVGHTEENRLNSYPRDKPIDPALLRTMILRYTAAGVALLALDERVRGEEVVVREMAQLDERGFFQKRSG